MAEGESMEGERWGEKGSEDGIKLFSNFLTTGCVCVFRSASVDKHIRGFTQSFMGQLPGEVTVLQCPATSGMYCSPIFK